ILFPKINTSVQVVSIKGGTVRLGIEAPPDVSILRAELKDAVARCQEAAETTDTAEARLRELRHLVRNRLSVTTVGLGLVRQQLRAGLNDEVERTLGKLEEEMQSLRQQLEGELTKASPPRPNPVQRTGRALLVEDDQNERELLAGFLRMSGFVVSTA